MYYNQEDFEFSIRINHPECKDLSVGISDYDLVGSGMFLGNLGELSEIEVKMPAHHMIDRDGRRVMDHRKKCPIDIAVMRNNDNSDGLYTNLVRVTYGFFMVDYNVYRYTIGDVKQDDLNRYSQYQDPWSKNYILDLNWHFYSSGYMEQDVEMQGKYLSLYKLEQVQSVATMNKKALIEPSQVSCS